MARRDAPPADAWRSALGARFERLTGQRVVGWWGIEMALREQTGAGPQFSDPGVPCLQLLAMGATLDSGATWRVSTYQDDDRWGLCIEESGDVAGEGPAEIFRRRQLTELPSGRIDALRLRTELETVAEVTLSVGGAELLLMAGEAHEESSGSLSWHRFDESVLVFTRPRDADSMVWLPPRR